MDKLKKSSIKSAAKYESKKSLDGYMKFLKGNVGIVGKNKFKSNGAIKKK